MITTMSYRMRGAIFAASLAGVAALALAAPAMADEYSESRTTTTYEAAPPPPPVAQSTTTTTTTTSTSSDDAYSEGYVADAPPPPPPPPPAPGITVGVPGVVGIHLGP